MEPELRKHANDEEERGEIRMRWGERECEWRGDEREMNKEFFFFFGI